METAVGDPHPQKESHRCNRMMSPNAVVLRDYPVKGCSGKSLTRTALRANFFHKHARDTMVILE